MINTALYSGSFDPITYGHIDIIKRASKMFDRIIVGVAENSKKTYLLPCEKRLALVSQTIKELDIPSTTVHYIDGLVVDFCRKNGLKTIVRGVRSISDFDQETIIANINKDLDPWIETIFLPALPHLAHVSSSAAKEIAKHNGNLTNYVRKNVENEMMNYI